MKTKIFLLIILLVSFKLFSFKWKSAGFRREQGWSEKIDKSPVPNFYRINNSFYRAAQPNKEAFNYLEQTGCKSILNLREDQNDSSKLVVPIYNLFAYQS